MKESIFQSKLKKTWEEQGALVFNVHGHAAQQSGWPDLQVYWMGRVAHVEVKVGSGELRPSQMRIILALNRRHIPAFVLRYRDKKITKEDRLGRVLETWNHTAIPAITVLLGTGC